VSFVVKDFDFSDHGDHRGSPASPLLARWGGITRDDGDPGDLLPTRHFSTLLQTKHFLNSALG
jgi:hypothetical protein